MGIRDWLSKRRPREVSSEALAKARQLAADLADQARLLHPLAGDRIEIDYEVVGDGARVGSVEVPNPSAGVVVPKTLVLDPALHTAHLSGLGDGLLYHLGAALKPRSRHRVTVLGDRVLAGGHELLYDPEALCFGPRFMEAVGELDGVAGSRQAALQKRLSAPGPAAIRWERDEGVIVFAPETGDPLRVRAEVLGSYSLEMSSWCWAYANSSLEPEHCRAIADLGARARLGEAEVALGRGGFPASEPFAFIVAYLAAHRLGGHPVWRWPLDGVQLFFAVIG